VRLLSIVSGCFNEEENVELLYKRLTQVIAQCPNYRFEIILIDNASTDRTVAKLKKIADNDKRLKIIVNMRNFGHIRSPYYALLQARGDAVIALASDLQDPPELIPEFIKKWEEGAQLVLGVKTESEENRLLYLIRTLYYKVHNSLADVKVMQHATGFGLYDKRIIDELKKLDERYPYLRGLIVELGFEAVEVPYVQQVRKHGRSTMNFYRMYDLAMVGLTSYSLVPMRIATFLGFGFAALSLIVSFFYLVYKLIFWGNFPFGLAPLIVGTFGMFSLQMMFTGLLGEYIGATHRDLVNRPLVVERERVNFEYDEDDSSDTASVVGATTSSP